MSGTKPNSAARDNFGAVPDPFRDLRVAVVLDAARTAAGRAPIYESLAYSGAAMTTSAMVTYAYDQIDQARAELNAVSK